MATSTIRFRAVMAGLRESRKVSKASDYLKGYVARFNKVDADSVRIDPKLNEYIMGSVVKMGTAVKVDITKDGALIRVKLAPGQAPAEYKPQEKQAQKPAADKAKPAQAKPESAAKPAAAPKAPASKAPGKPADQAPKRDEAVAATPAAQSKPAKKKQEPQKTPDAPAKPPE